MPVSKVQINDLSADSTPTGSDELLFQETGGGTTKKITVTNFATNLPSVAATGTVTAGTAFVPDAADGATLGTASLEFSDLFLADAAVINLGNDQDTTLTHVADTGILLNSTRQLQFGDSGTYIHQSADGVLDLVADTEIEINATTIDMNGNVEISGDLTVTGDDITMGTNTAGNLLVADGTNFNSIAVDSLSEISTVASDDVLMAVDTSGGGLKKITRSTLVSGLATSSGISNVVEDTSPQLGGNLDMNGQDIVTTSNADLELAPNGTGHVTVKGNDNSGAIQFNCENNSHGQILKAQPHSAAVTNELLLPAGANSTLVSLVSTDTLTNKTLTSPKINEDVAVSATATEINLLDGVTASTTELNYLDITTLGTTEASKVVTTDANGVPKFDAAITEKIVTASTSGTTLTIDVRDGSVFVITLGHNIGTLTLNNAVSSYASQFVLMLKQDGTGSRSFAWGSVKWAGGTAPTVSQGANDIDIYILSTLDGSNWYGFNAGQAFA